jgi:hypothetical protein
MSCPYLKEVRMVFCRAYPVKKLVPLGELVSVSCCETDCAFQGCAAFQEARARVEQAMHEGELVDELAGLDREEAGSARRRGEGEARTIEARSEKGRTP